MPPVSSARERARAREAASGLGSIALGSGIGGVFFVGETAVGEVDGMEALMTDWSGGGHA